MGAREDQRRAWREAVARAAEEWGRKDAAVRCFIAAPSWDGRGYGLQGLMEDREPAEMALREALSAPKTWARARAGADLGKWGAMPSCDGWPCFECESLRRAHLRRKRRVAQRRGR